MRPFGPIGLHLLRTLLAAAIATASLLPLPASSWYAWAAPEAQFLRVALTGSDTSACGTETTPCQSIQYAANKAASGDILLVAGGTYTYKSSADTCSFLTTRAVVCFVDKNLAILGGYAPGNWSTPDPVANLTVIDGGNSRRGVAIIAYNTTASLRMEGFTIQNGLAQGASSGTDFYTFAFGGGLWAQNSAVTLRNITFRSNRSVGGNTALQYGGAGSGGGLAIQSTKNGVTNILEHIRFDSNQAIGGSGVQRGGLAVGGGLYTFEAALTGTDLSFTNNIAQAGSSSGNGIDSTIGLRADAIGGGASFQIGSSANLTGVSASGNQAIGGNAGTGSAAQAGGGFGAGLHAEKSTFVLSTASITGNTARGGRSATGGFAFGGGLLTDASYVTIQATKVINNAGISGSSLTGGSSGVPGGGGAYLTAFSGTGYTGQVVNSIFADNRIELGTPGSSAGGGGAGLVIQSMQVDLIHTTIARNYFSGDLRSGQAVMVQGPNGVPGTANIRYSILSDHVNPVTTNTSALTVAQGSTANITRVLFAGNTNDTNLNNRPITAGTFTGMNTVLVANPVHYISPGAPAYDYHLASNSPAIDQAAGSTLTTDIDGDPRPIGPYPDIGADEVHPTATILTFSLYLPLTRK